MLHLPIINLYFFPTHTITHAVTNGRLLNGICRSLELLRLGNNAVKRWILHSSNKRRYKLAAALQTLFLSLSTLQNQREDWVWLKWDIFEYCFYSEQIQGLLSILCRWSAPLAFYVLQHHSCHYLRIYEDYEDNNNGFFLTDAARQESLLLTRWVDERKGRGSTFVEVRRRFLTKPLLDFWLRPKFSPVPSISHRIPRRTVGFIRLII